MTDLYNVPNQSLWEESLPSSSTCTFQNMSWRYSPEQSEASHLAYIPLELPLQQSLVPHEGVKQCTIDNCHHQVQQEEDCQQEVNQSVIEQQFREEQSFNHPHLQKGQKICVH